VVFKLDPTGKETVLHSFAGAPTDGAFPVSGLIRDKAGNFYGTTRFGGASDFGTVFKLDSTGKETVLYSFTGGDDGGDLQAGVVRDSAGNLYGTTIEGGTFGVGVVFKLDPTGKETVQYHFTGGADGALPYARLVRDKAGNLYGATAYGGLGCGVVFRLDSTGNETVLYSFTCGADGAQPRAGLLRDKAGNLYGTTESGGNSNFGVVFKLDITGEETVLHTFTGPDGLQVDAGLVRDPKGNLYGTTVGGGASGNGVVFKLTP